MEAITMTQTDPLRTVCSGSILFALLATKEHKQMRGADNKISDCQVKQKTGDQLNNASAC